jgi:hypothetical protein
MGLLSLFRVGLLASHKSQRSVMAFRLPGYWPHFSLKRFSTDKCTTR